MPFTLFSHLSSLILFQLIILTLSIIYPYNHPFPVKILLNPPNITVKSVIIKNRYLCNKGEAMDNSIKEDLKKLVGYNRLPTCVLSAEKKADGTHGEVRICAINEAFKRSFFSVFADFHKNEIKYDDFEDFVVGKSYTTFLPKEPKFEDLVFKAAWDGEFVHTYVDTTRVYDYWTEDILLPVCCEHEDNIAYCQFMYNLNKEMDTSKFAAVSPDISSFVIKTCLELKNDYDFKSSLATVAKDIREYTNSFTVAMLSLNSNEQSFEIISESILSDAFSVKEIFKDISYNVVDSWSALMEGTNEIIIQNEDDMVLYESKAPEWVYTLRRDNVKSLCLVPFIHHKKTIGYLFIANFDIAETTRIKACIELVSFFLSSELANYLHTESQNQ